MNIFNFKSLVISSLVLTSFSSIAEDAALTSQKSACSGKASMEWSSTLNRCVTKKEAFETKNAVAECNKKESLEERKNCNLEIANSKAALGESAEGSIDKLDSGATRSALVNGANTVISVLNMMASGDGTSKNTCMSKNILAAAAIGGTVTDILMKIKMKKASEELQKKYEVTKNDSAYTAQYKALEFLRDGQQVVKDIADWEVKRQTLLMIGYGAAMATGIWEATSGQSKCEGKEEPKKEETAKKVTQEEPTKKVTPAEPDKKIIQEENTGAQSFPVKDNRENVVGKPLGDLTDNTSGQVTAAAVDPGPKSEYVIQKTGKSTYNMYETTDGKVTAVYYGGKPGAADKFTGSDIFQTNKIGADGQPIWAVRKGAVGTPSGDQQSFFKANVGTKK